MTLFRIVAILWLGIFFHTAVAEPIIQLNVVSQPPLNTASQNGFMDEVTAEAFLRIGIEFKAVRLPAERALKHANRGIIDGEVSRIKGLDKIYTNLMRVPEKIMDWEFMVFSYQTISLKNGWQDLSDQLVAYINGWKILENNIPASAEVTKTADSDELFNLLKKKRTDFVVYERWAGHYKLQEMRMDDVKEQKSPLAVKEMFIYLHKKHKALIPKLAVALASMKKDGSYQKLVTKHLSTLVR